MLECDSKKAAKGNKFVRGALRLPSIPFLQVMIDANRVSDSLFRGVKLVATLQASHSQSSKGAGSW